MSDSRLEAARKLGANETVLIDTSPPEDIARQVSELIGAQPDITIECSGAESSIQMAVHVKYPMLHTYPRTIHVYKFAMFKVLFMLLL